MLGHLIRRWPNIKSRLGQRLVFTGHTNYSLLHHTNTQTNKQKVGDIEILHAQTRH